MYKKYFQYYLSSTPEGHHFSGFDNLDLPDFALVNSVLELDYSLVFTRAQGLVAQILNVSLKSQIHFFENSNQALTNIFNKYQHRSKLKVLTSDSEFFDLTKFKGDLDITKVSTMPFDNFNFRLIETIKQNHYDIIFLSSIFYNSGMILQNVEDICRYIDFEKTEFILDGNRSFLHIPTDLSPIENHITYFASARNWFGTDICIHYSPEAKFASTLPLSINQLIKAIEFFREQGIKVEDMYSHIKSIQKKFREKLLTIDHFYLVEKNILNINYDEHGWFYAFALPSAEIVEKLFTYLNIHKIKTDKIDSRLIFHFKLYQDERFDLDFLKDHRKI